MTVDELLAEIDHPLAGGMPRTATIVVGGTLARPHRVTYAGGDLVIGSELNPPVPDPAVWGCPACRADFDAANRQRSDRIRAEREAWLDQLRSADYWIDAHGNAVLRDELEDGGDPDGHGGHRLTGDADEAWATGGVLIYACTKPGCDSTYALRLVRYVPRVSP